jgi:N-carbamoylputrescine amidase
VKKPRKRAKSYALFAYFPSKKAHEMGENRIFVAIQKRRKNMKIGKNEYDGTSLGVKPVPEWVEQSFVQLTWPHENTDWADCLDEARDCFLNIAREIVRREDLLIVAPDIKDVAIQLYQAGINPDDTGHRIVLYECPTNDTWARDHGFLTVQARDNTPLLLNYQFNGWGNKYPSEKDNAINEVLYCDKVIVSSTNNHSPKYVNRQDLVLEGGSVEFNDHGDILTTAQCLLAPNRNPWKRDDEVENWLRSDFNGANLFLLHHGQLTGDDTDGHIDTLARFVPGDAIVYVKADDEADIDYKELSLMEKELEELVSKSKRPLRLIPLPMPRPVYDEGGYRLPATYANFLIINGAVLMPTYNQPDKDEEALQILRSVFLDREVVGIDCSVLIRQHGSLHCVTMQYPSLVRLSTIGERVRIYNEEFVLYVLREKSTTPSNTLRVALIQQAMGSDVDKNCKTLAHAIRTAAKQGAKLVVLQELHNTLYFCQVEDTNNFDYAEPIPGPSTEFYGALARANGIVLVTSLFERRAAGLYHNTAVIFEKDGSIAGKYRKMHIPDDPAYYEKFYFTPGDLGFHPTHTSVGCLGVQVCWDQWYPEGARLMALQGAELLIYPTAIGWESSDTEEEKARQLEAWKTVQRGHAVANGLPVIAVNRVGLEKDPSNNTNGIKFWGHSFVAGPQGEILAEAEESPTTLIVDIDMKRCENVRRWWPFLRDRRIEEFSNLTRRFIDE